MLKNVTPVFSAAYAMLSFMSLAKKDEIQQVFASFFKKMFASITSAVKNVKIDREYITFL